MEWEIPIPIGMSNFESWSIKVPQICFIAFFVATKINKNSNLDYTWLHWL